MRITRPSTLIAFGVILAAPIAHLQAQAILGPENPTLDGSQFDPYNSFWNFGGNAGSEPEGGAIAETGRLTLTGDGSGDFRADSFSLGAAANAAEELTISFQFMFSEEVQAGDNIRVGLRFNDSNDNFLGEHNVYIGSSNGNGTLLNDWQAFSQGGIVAHADSVLADIRVSANIFGDDNWSSGLVSFDDFSVSTVPEPSTYALFGGLLALGAVLVRRKFTRRR